MKRILIIGNYAFGKKYMQHAKRLGYEVILAAAVSKSNLSALETACMDYYIQIDYFNEEETIKKIERFYKNIPFEGILAGHVFLPKLVNLLTVHLNLPSFGTKAVECVMSKEKTREKLKESGLFNEKFFIFSSKQEIIRKKASLSYPCIMKPLNGFGSINVEKVNSFDELLSAFEKNATNLDYGILGPIFTKQVLVEPFISGKEFSVESVVEKGIVNSIMITEKVFNEKFENVENGHIIPAVRITLEEEKQIVNYVEKIHELFEICTGITHTEVKINQSGVHLIELNPRVGGGFIAEMLSRVLNVDFYKIIIENCVGKNCELKFMKKGFGYIKFIHSPRKGKFVGFQNLEDLKKDKNFIDMEYKIAPKSNVKNLSDNRGRLALFAYFNEESFESVNLSAKLLQELAKIEIGEES